MKRDNGQKYIAIFFSISFSVFFFPSFFLLVAIEFEITPNLAKAIRESSRAKRVLSNPWPKWATVPATYHFL